MIQGQEGVTFLKLGGSLITDKRQPETPRLEVITRLAQEIATAVAARPQMRLILGHGSGSFGHMAAHTYGTRQGVHTSVQWYGFARTADSAYHLTRLVTRALLDAGTPVWSLQSSVALRCVDGQIVVGPDQTVQEALAHGLVPLVHGDVALDTVRGGTIASTEEIFIWLAQFLPPSRLILAGEVDGVYTGDPLQDPTATPIPIITPQSLAAMAGSLGGSHGVDVTGGMAAKVRQCVELVQQYPALSITLCSGLHPDHVYQALVHPEKGIGTRIVGADSQN